MANRVRVSRLSKDKVRSFPLYYVVPIWVKPLLSMPAGVCIYIYTHKLQSCNSYAFPSKYFVYKDVPIKLQDH